MAARLSHLRPIAQTSPLPITSTQRRRTYISATALTALRDQPVSSNGCPRKKIKLPKDHSEISSLVSFLLPSSKKVPGFSLLNTIEKNFPLCPYYQFLDVRTFARFRCLGKKYSYKQRVQNYFIANPHQMQVMIWRNQQSLTFHGAWQEILTGPRGIETLSLSGTSLLAGTPLRTFSNLKAIKLFNCRVCDGIFEDLASLTNLTSLHITVVNQGAEHLNWNRLFGNPNLKSLTFKTEQDFFPYPPIALPDEIQFGQKLKHLVFGSYSIAGKKFVHSNTLKSFTTFTSNENFKYEIPLNLHSFNVKNNFLTLEGIQNLYLFPQLKSLNTKVFLNYEYIQALINHPTLENIELNLQLENCIKKSQVSSLNSAIFLLLDSKFKRINLIWNYCDHTPFCKKADILSTETFVNVMLQLAHKIYRVYVSFSEIFSDNVLTAFSGREFICTHFFYVGHMSSYEFSYPSSNITQLLRSFPKVTSLVVKCVPLKCELPIEKLHSLRLRSHEYSSEFLRSLSLNVQTNLSRLELIRDFDFEHDREIFISTTLDPLFQNANLRLHHLSLIDMNCQLSTLSTLLISQRKLRHLLIRDHPSKEFIEGAPKILAEFPELETLGVDRVNTKRIAASFQFEDSYVQFQEE